MVGVQDFFPRHVLLNGQACMLRIGLNLNVPIPTVLPNGTLIEDNEQPVSVTLGQFIGAKGEPLTIKGINWCARPRPCRPAPPLDTPVVNATPDIAACCFVYRRGLAAAASGMHVHFWLEDISKAVF